MQSIKYKAKMFLGPISSLKVFPNIFDKKNHTLYRGIFLADQLLESFFSIQFTRDLNSIISTCMWLFLIGGELEKVVNLTLSNWAVKNC